MRVTATLSTAHCWWGRGRAVRSPCWWVGGAHTRTRPNAAPPQPITAPPPCPQQQGRGGSQPTDGRRLRGHHGGRLGPLCCRRRRRHRGRRCRVRRRSRQWRQADAYGGGVRRVCRPAASAPLPLACRHAWRRRRRCTIGGGRSVVQAACSMWRKQRLSVGSSVVRLVRCVSQESCAAMWPHSSVSRSSSASSRSNKLDHPCQVVVVPTTCSPAYSA